MGSELRASDEGAHAPAAEEPWREWWSFDFTAPAAALGGFVRLTIHPGLRAAWFWAALVGDGRPLVLVRDHEVPLPRPPSLDLRTEGLWAALVCEAPFDHWSIGMEAFAVALDDPSEALRGERGQRVPFGLDLEWEAEEEARRRGRGYGQGGFVHGQVLVGRERIDLDARGWREHRWEVWAPAAGRHDAAVGLDDGTWATVSAMAPEQVGKGADATTFAGDGLVLAARLRHQVPMVLAASPGSSAALVRSLGRFRAEDGRLGAGWAERLVS